MTNIYPTWLVEHSYAAIPAPGVRNRNYSYPISHQSSMACSSSSRVWDTDSGGVYEGTVFVPVTLF